MPHRIVQPTKEQVRAYMAAREAARRPPPAPEEIRRMLGWRLGPSDTDCPLLKFYLIPTQCSHLAASLALDLLAVWPATALFPFGKPVFLVTKTRCHACENLTACPNTNLSRYDVDFTGVTAFSRYLLGDCLLFACNREPVANKSRSVNL